jgi:hypothetical protein
MEVVSNLALGFSVSLQPLNLLMCFICVALGVVIGILPGLGSAATMTRPVSADGCGTTLMPATVIWLASSSSRPDSARISCAGTKQCQTSAYRATNGRVRRRPEPQVAVPPARA